MLYGFRGVSMDIYTSLQCYMDSAWHKPHEVLCGNSDATVLSEPFVTYCSCGVICLT